MENDRYKGIPPLTSPEFWTAVADHMSAFFPTDLPEIKTYRLAAHALRDGDIPKAERILEIKLRP